MPEPSLLLLPKFGPPLPRITRQLVVKNTYKLPSSSDQSSYFGPKLDSMLEAVVVDSPTATSPENILVLETVGKLDGFRSAVSSVPGLKWLAEIDLEEISSDDRFYDRPKVGPRFFKSRIEGVSSQNSKDISEAFSENGLIDDDNLLKPEVTTDDIRDAIPEGLTDFTEQIIESLITEKSKPVSGRMYLSLSNRQGLEKIKRFFDEWEAGGRLPHGAGQWSDIFAHLKTVRFWDVEDRICETGILEFWEEEVELKCGTASKILFEAEFTYRSTDAERQAVQQQVTALVHAERGGVTAYCHIPEIHFHAIKLELPVDAIENVLAGSYSALFRSGGVLFFRPTAQCCVPTTPDGTLDYLPAATPVVETPVVALLDGLPFAQHALIRDFLLLDDPDDFSAAYLPREMSHGTGMASLICRGELDSDGIPSRRRIYTRPILKPDPLAFGGPRPEKVPHDVFFEDLVERAVRRIFEGEGPEPPVAPEVKIINLSVADPDRMFHSFPGPTARLLDWLSFKYGVLFCVSAGNMVDGISLDVEVDEFVLLDDDAKTSVTLTALNEARRNRRILSPSESINSLTVGALHDDHSTPVIVDGRIDLIPHSFLPSPVSPCGHGFRSSIKPEILLPGGRQLYSHQGDGQYCLNASTLPPGQKVASPPVSAGEVSRTIYTRGTSNATALATRHASFVYEALSEVASENDIDIPDRNIGPLLKTLMVHGASWGDGVEHISHVLDVPSQLTKKEVARFLGYGVPDPGKSTHSTFTRATGIGFGAIGKDQRHEFKLPLPQSLSGKNCWRRLTITLGWFTPISVDNRKYRKAALTFEATGVDEIVGGKRSQANWQQVRNGTVQHEVIEGARVTAYAIGESIVVPVQCREDAGVLDETIYYGLAVSLEVKEELPIYEEVKEGIAVINREIVGERV